MVSLKGSVLKYMLLPFMALIFIILFAVNGYAQNCTSSQQSCCKGSVLSCCPKLYPANPGDPYPSYDLSACMGDIKPVCMESEVSMSNCGVCKVGATCYRTSDCSYQCRGGSIIPMCIEKEVAMSNCGRCLLGSTCYQLSDCSYQCRIDGGIELGCTVGAVQYRPSGDCDTEENICCSDGNWSGYGNLCSGGGIINPPKPTYCSSSDKPACYLPFGTCTGVNCTCVDGVWKDCKIDGYCNAGYTTVRESYGVCCEKSDGTGPLCRRTAIDGGLIM